MADIDPDQAQQLQQLQIALTSGAMPGLGGVLPAFGASPPAAPEAPPPSGDSYAPTPMTGYDAAITKNESGGNPYAHSQIPGQTASGLFGFTDGTYQQTIKNHPDLVDTSGRPLDRNDPRVLHALTIDNAKEISPQIGRQPTQVDLMAAHLLGAAGAVHFLRSDPNSSVVGAVSPEALANNKQVFFNPDGSPKTVAQVYADAAQKVKADPAMPPVEGGYAPAYSNQHLASGAANAPALTASGTAGGNPYAGQQAKIDAYEAGQPAMWAKLKAMQDEYKQATRPTFMNDIQDALAGMQQQQAIAQGNMHANAGAILSHVEQPSGKDFAAALASGHAIDMAQRQHRYDQAKSDYEVGSTTVMAQNAQQLSNLGLSGDLAKNIASYGQTGRQLDIEQQKANTEATSVGNTMTINLLKYDQEQVKLFQDTLDHVTNDKNVQAEILRRFLATGGNPRSSSASNVAALNKVASDYIANPTTAPGATAAPAPGATAPSAAPAPGGSLNTPGKQLEYTWWDDKAGKQVSRTVDEHNPGDMEWVRTQKPANAVAHDPTATQVTTNVGAGGSGGGSAGGDLADQHMQAIKLKQDADAAASLLPYLQAHHGTGPLTGSDGNAIASSIKQAIGLDVTGVDVRVLYNKLMQRVQNGLTLPSMKLMGARPAAAEFAILQKGELGDSATIPAATEFLSHVSKTADWTQRQIEAQVADQQQAKRANDLSFDPVASRIAWQKNPINQPPDWHGQDLIDAVDKANSGKTGSPQGQPAPLLSPQATHGFVDWARGKLGMAAQPVAPIAPIPKLPISPDEERFLRGGP